MALKDTIIAKIKEELTTDPNNVGYSGKTNSEILDLLNNPVYKQRIVQDQETAPIARILVGLADAPNICSLQDVIDAKLQEKINGWHAYQSNIFN